MRRSPIVFYGGFPPKVKVCGRRIHHVWFALLWALTDVRDWRVWVSDLHKK